MRLRVPVGTVLFGLPLDMSENGYIIAETGRIIADAEIYDCIEKKIIINKNISKFNIQDFFNKVVEELELNICIKLDVKDIIGEYTDIGLYAAITATLFKEIAEYHGETVEPYELIEYTTMLDPLINGSSWRQVFEALRYCSLSGGVVVYRNIDEYFKLLDKNIFNIKILDKKYFGEQRVKKQELGSDLYGSLIHLVGVMVLEASLRIKDQEKPESFTPLFKLQKNIAEYFWDYDMEGYPSPGFPGYFYSISVRG